MKNVSNDIILITLLNTLGIVSLNLLKYENFYSFIKF